MILFFCERFYISLKTNWLISNQIDISLLAKTQWANEIKQSNGSPRWDTDSKIKWIKIAAYKILFGGKFNCQRQYLNGWQWDFLVFHLSHWPYDIYANVDKIYESHQNRNAMFKHYDEESTGWCYCHLSTYERHSERKQMLTHRCVHIYIYIAASCWWCAENIRKEKFFVFRWMKFVMRICVFWVIWPKISNYNCLMQRSHLIELWMQDLMKLNNKSSQFRWNSIDVYTICFLGSSEVLIFDLMLFAVQSLAVSVRHCATGECGD